MAGRAVEGPEDTPLENAEPSAIANWTRRLLVLLMMALGANKVFSLHWLAPWDVGGDIGFYSVVGILFAWVAWERRQRNLRPPDPERAHLAAQWSAPGGNLSTWKVAGMAVVSMGILVVATLRSSPQSDELWIQMAPVVILVVVFVVVLQRNQRRTADNVVENGAGLSVSRGNREQQIAWSQIAGIHHEIKHDMVTVRIDLKDDVPPFGKTIQFTPRASADLSDAERTMMLAEMRKRAGLGV